jgi:hypothetical protein
LKSPAGEGAAVTAAVAERSARTWATEAMATLMLIEQKKKMSRGRGQESR